MSFYANVLFPMGYDRMMSRAPMQKARTEYLAGVSGEVLEIGFGTGLNLPHYPRHVRRLTTVDVNPGMSRKARRRIAASAIEVEQKLLNGERLPMADGSYDSVVSAYTLCSIGDIKQALDEIFRVLKTGGGLFFLEHGLSREPHIECWQHRLTPLQKCTAGWIATCAP